MIDLLINMGMSRPTSRDIILGGGYVLKPVEIDEKYRKKWHIHGDDFLSLTKDGKPVNKTLYRKGGLGGRVKDGYLLLLKYVEDIYDPKVIKNKTKAERRHLDGRWTIMNTDGVEKVVDNGSKLSHIYHSGGQIYSNDREYYNIETGEFYGKAYQCIKSDDFLFLENPYDDDESKRGVMKINKWDGTFELFPSKR